MKNKEEILKEIDMTNRGFEKEKERHAKMEIGELEEYGEDIYFYSQSLGSRIKDGKRVYFRIKQKVKHQTIKTCEQFMEYARNGVIRNLGKHIWFAHKQHKVVLEDGRKMFLEEAIKLLKGKKYVLFNKRVYVLPELSNIKL